MFLRVEVALLDGESFCLPGACLVLWRAGEVQFLGR